MERIEPSHFDVVIVSSGLPEVLLASALAKAGQSVLLIDGSDSYGSEWATHASSSFPALAGPRSAAAAPSAAAAADAAAAAPAAPDEWPESWSAVALPASPLPGVQRGRLYTAPGSHLEDRAHLWDLCPKALYQGEPLVDLLIATRAHAYLDFKLVEGSFIHRRGRLHPVPATRADIFTDRSLPLGDKRILMRFLTACLEATEAQGRLRDAFGEAPLAGLLRAERLSGELQQAVLYALAMSETPQGEGAHDGPASRPSPSCDAAGAASDAAAGAAPTAAGAAAGGRGRELSAAAGLAALRLYVGSVGRFGGRSAFMVPAYGSGTLPEAFVRLAAVAGAVTVLRRPATHALLAPPPPGDGDVGDGDVFGDGARRRRRCAGVAVAGGQVVRCGTLVGSARALGSLVAAADGAAAAAARASDADADGGGGSAARGAAVARAVAVLDASLVDGLGSLLLVVPPGSVGAGQRRVVRGLQLGPGAAVAPQRRFLLHLTARLAEGAGVEGEGGRTPATAADAEAVLAPVLAALARVGALRAAATGAAAGEAAAASAGAGAEGVPRPPPPPQHTNAATGGGADAPVGGGAAAAAGEAAAGVDLRPRALAVLYYVQSGCADADADAAGAAADAASSALPPNVVGCPGADGALVGYLAATAAAERLYRRHFPHLRWPGDCERAGEGVGGGGADRQGGEAAGQLLDDGEADALDDLLSALEELAPPAAATGAAGGAAAGGSGAAAPARP